MMKITNKNSAFTLVELIIVVAIFGVLFIVVSNTFFNVVKAAAKVEALKEVRQQGDVILNRITNELRNAQRVVVYSNTSSTCNSESTGSATNRLVFKDQSGHVVRYTSGGSGELRLRRTVAINDDAMDWENSEWNAAVAAAQATEGTINDYENAGLVDGTVVFDCSQLLSRGLVTISFLMRYQQLDDGTPPMPIVPQRSEDRVEAFFTTTVAVR